MLHVPEYCVGGLAHDRIDEPRMACHETVALEPESVHQVVLDVGSRSGGMDMAVDDWRRREVVPEPDLALRLLPPGELDETLIDSRTLSVSEA